MLKVWKNYGKKRKKVLSRNRCQTALRLQLENTNLYVPPICMSVFIFPLAFTNPGVGVEKEIDTKWQVVSTSIKTEEDFNNVMGS